MFSGQAILVGCVQISCFLASTLLLCLTVATTKEARKSLHFPRRVFHAASGITATLVFTTYSRSDFYFSNIACFVFCATCEILKLNWPAFRDAGMKVLSFMTRPHEAHRFSGVAYYVFGTLVAAMLSEHLFKAPELGRWAFIASLTNLALGDPVAAMAGTTLVSAGWLPAFLKGKKRGKSWFASWIATAINTFMGLILYFLYVESPGLTLSTVNVIEVSSFISRTLLLNNWKPVILCLVLGRVGAATELAVPSPYPCLPFTKFPLGTDDNFWIAPVSVIAAAVTCYCISM